MIVIALCAAAAVAAVAAHYGRKGSREVDRILDDVLGPREDE